MTNTDTSTAAKPGRLRRAKATTDTAQPPAATAVKTASKSDTVIKLLLRAKGASPMELIAATDWQPHSLRAFLSGLRKKGQTIVREDRKGGGFAYRIVTVEAAAKASEDVVASNSAAAADDAPPAVDGAVLTVDA